MSDATIRSLIKNLLDTTSNSLNWCKARRAVHRHIIYLRHLTEHQTLNIFPLWRENPFIQLRLQRIDGQRSFWCIIRRKVNLYAQSVFTKNIQLHIRDLSVHIK